MQKRKKRSEDRGNPDYPKGIFNHRDKAPIEQALIKIQEIQGLTCLRLNKKGKLVDQHGKEHRYQNGTIVKISPPKKPKPLRTDPKLAYSLIIAEIDENTGYADIYGTYPWSPSYAERLMKWLEDYLKWARHYHPEYFVPSSKRKKK